MLGERWTALQVAHETVKRTSHGFCWGCENEGDAAIDPHLEAVPDKPKACFLIKLPQVPTAHRIRNR